MPRPFILDRGVVMEVSEIIVLFVEVITQALPFTIVFWMGELIVTTFLRAAFSGRLSFKAF